MVQEVWNSFMDLSIIICSHNRATDLKIAMQSLTAMHLPDNMQCEVIIVDNNSTDNTKEIVENQILHCPLNIRYVFEPQQGLSNARNRGVEEARGAIIAFTDDDCIADTYWLTNLVNEFQADTALDGIGGRVELFDIRDKPVTIMTSMERATFETLGQLFSFLHGCNMAFRREVFQEVGCFDNKLGAGTKISSAEDSDFIYRVYKNGFKIIYSPDVLVYHNHGRRTDEQVAKLKRGYTIGKGAFYCKHMYKRDIKILKMAYWEVSALLRIIMNCMRNSTASHKALQQIGDMFIGAYYFSASLLKL